MWDHFKGLTEAKVDDIHISSLVHWCGQSIVDGHQITQAHFSLRETILGVSNHLSGIHMPWHNFHKSLYHDITGDRDKAVCTVAPMNLLFI